MAAASSDFDPCTQANPVIEGLLASVAKAAQKNIVTILEKIIQLLLQVGLAVYLVLPPEQVGIHPRNRYGVGVIVHNLHKLGASIYQMGFSFLACKDAICIEDGDDRLSAKNTVRIQANSEMLPKQKEAEIVAGSVANTHTNQFLVMAIQGTKTNQEILSSPATPGHIDSTKMRNQEQLGKAMSEGIPWLMIKAQAVRLYPTLPDLIQQARQVTGQVQNRETQVELLVSIAGIQQAMGEHIDWDKAADLAEQDTKVEWKEDAPKSNSCVIAVLANWEVCEVLEQFTDADTRVSVLWLSRTAFDPTVSRQVASDWKCFVEWQQDRRCRHLEQLVNDARNELFELARWTFFPFGANLEEFVCHYIHQNGDPEILPDVASPDA